MAHTHTAAYIRVSTQGQSEQFGLETQRQAIVAFCAVQNIVIDQWFQDVESGSVERREGLDSLRGAVASGQVTRVVTYKMDRLSRDVLLAETLWREMSARAKVVSVSEYFEPGPIGDLMRMVLSAFAQYERSVIAMRTKAGKAAKTRSEGTYIGGQGVYGYRPVGRRGASGDGQLAVHPEEAAVVRTIFAMEGEGLTSRAIADRLNEAGRPTFGGGPWTHTQVLRVLRRREFYAGTAALACPDPGKVAHQSIIAKSA